MTESRIASELNETLDISRMEKIRSYLTACENCISILEEQAKDELEKLKIKNPSCGYNLRKRKENGLFYVEIWKPRV